MGMDEYDCCDCIFEDRDINESPCNECKLGDGISECFIPKTGEEINHPTRYAGGKYECIDVMTDVFGVDAVKSFCKLNAFKYLWREQNKNGVEDLKKCAWYLDKLIELSDQN